MGGNFRPLFPDGVSVATSNKHDNPPSLMTEERRAVADAVPSRQREFALGRWCARRALAQLGLDTPPIPVGERRAPVWPVGVVGSITHCAGFVGAVVARADRLRSIGFDAERSDPLAEDLIPLVCTAREMEWLRSRSSSDVDWAKVIFSAKESIHKCIWPLCGMTLDFLDLSIMIDVDPKPSPHTKQNHHPQQTLI